MANNTSTVLLKAAGLITSPNELERADGALIEAENVVIRRDGIIEQRRGFALYGDALPSPGQRVKQLTTYRNRILRHYSNKIQFDSNGLGRFVDFSGEFSETETGLRMKFAESNGNLYFTTTDGIKKISARNADDFLTTNPTSAGAVKAVDFTVRTLYTANSQSAFLPQDGAVSYRILWGYKDLNNNLILGAPSQRVVASNPMKDLLIHDYMRLLEVLDSLDNTPLTTARINDKDYIATLGLNLASSASTLRANLIALATKIDNDIFIADNAAVAPLQISSASVTSNILTVTFTASPASYIFPGDKIFFGGTWTGAGAENLSGAQTVVSVVGNTITINVTATNGAVVLASPTIYSNEFRSITQPAEPSIPPTNDDLVDLQNYIEDILTTLVDLPTAILSTSDNALVNALDVTTTSTVQLKITIPVGVTSDYFFQIYRSSVAKATGAATFDDVVPSDELQLVYEAFPTVPELTAREVTVEDVTPDAFRGANLYTNASTGEGILAANDIPPFAKDINRYRNCLFYANTRTLHRSSLNLLGVVQMYNDYLAGNTPKLTIANSFGTNTYSFVVGQQEYIEISANADVADSLDGKYFTITSPLNDYYVWYSTGAGAPDPIPSGYTAAQGINVTIITGETANNVALKTRNKLATYLDDFIITGTTNKINVRNVDVGYVKPYSAGTAGFGTFQPPNSTGRGERIQPQIISMTPTTNAAGMPSVGTSAYVTFNSANDERLYYIWLKNGASTDPAIPGRIGIEVELTGTETQTQIRDLLIDAVPTEDFTAETLGIFNLTYTAKKSGPAGAPTDNGWIISGVQQVGATEVLLSPLTSPARAVDETARSLVRIINKDPESNVYAYYLSSAFDVPGKMLLEARDLADADPFYILGNNSVTGASFNPDISPDGFITSISAANPTVITTSIDHGMLTGDKVLLTNTDSNPLCDGLYEITRLTNNTFTINKAVTLAGSTGSFIRATAGVFSENETRSNRVYYSKFSQPEAVPISNFFDVGAQDKAILRIFPLRDSLFVFKEDGLFRISGESAPFQLELFDNSFICLAPDSVSVANNVIYAWTTQGIQSLTEGGSSIISRNIDNVILRLQSSNFPGFKTATWGIGYESDNSYLVFTVENEGDTFAQKGYRYSTLTDSWTNYTMGPLAGTVNPADDKLYLAANDVAYIEQERKTFSRLDYADREVSSEININKLLANNIFLTSITGIEIGDVVVQDQTITTYEFNTLLEKLDGDSGVDDNDYLSTLRLVAGDSPRNRLEALANKLDADLGISDTDFATTIASKNGVITNISENNPTIITSVAHGLITGRVVLIDSSDSTPSVNGEHVITVIDADTFSIPIAVAQLGSAGNWQTVNTSFQDLKTCYNKVVDKLNNDTGVAFNNYKDIDNNTIQEAIITDINTVTRKITLNLTLDYLVGDITIYKSIQSRFTYSPTTFGDPLNLKHLSEATMMFETRTLTGGTLSFATDLLPEFIEVDFDLAGNGIFGHSVFGEGFFGGLGNSAPFRTYIPRQCQRCRYILVRFSHNTAREHYLVTGMTLTGIIGLSTRAYR